MRIGILNIGYADGYLRLLADAGYAWAGDRPCRILGRISMDLMAVDIPQAGLLERFESDGEKMVRVGDVQLPAVEVGEGDWLELHFKLPELAGPLSQYELLTGLGSRFERRWT